MTTAESRLLAGFGVAMDAAAQAPGSRPRILLADDEAAITDDLAPFLERSGFEVEVVRDGEAAIRAVAEREPDVLVLDVLMPGLDGREVLRRVRAGGHWHPVLLLT
jgi:DNA-binding response OmpR family regulator